MPHIVHRDELLPTPLEEGSGNRYDLLGEEKADLIGASCELVTLDPGERTTDHAHDGCEHYIFVLEGIGSLELGGEGSPIAQNYLISIEDGEVHALHNTGESKMELLEILIPTHHQSAPIE